MKKPSLTVDRLLRAGFEEVGCWELGDKRNLIHNIDLPSRAGVYAFAVNGLVQYVGLASESLRKRLGFYRKPGPTQGTNIRLNSIICAETEKGAAVQILIASPPNLEWNGWTIRGAEGLEAGLIAAFDLRWNKRGMHGGAPSQVLEAIRSNPGLTQRSIAQLVYGANAQQQQVNYHCRTLVEAGQVERRGTGGASDPFIYYARD